VVVGVAGDPLGRWRAAGQPEQCLPQPGDITALDPGGRAFSDGQAVLVDEHRAQLGGGEQQRVEQVGLDRSVPDQLGDLVRRPERRAERDQQAHPGAAGDRGVALHPHPPHPAVGPSVSRSPWASRGSCSRPRSRLTSASSRR
jgi:hypothetical protein